MDEKEKIRISFFDFISGIVLLIISILLFVYGIYIINTMRLGKGIEWYVSPALMPLFISVVIGSLSVLLILKNRTSVHSYISNYSCGKQSIRANSVKDKICNYKKSNIMRFIIALLLIFIYIFVFIGRVPFTVATFIYLVLNMLLFRENSFSLWKIIVISLITTIAIYYGFGVVAKIPMP